MIANESELTAWKAGMESYKELIQPEIDQYRDALEQILWARPLGTKPSKLVLKIEGIARAGLDQTHEVDKGMVDDYGC